MILRGFSYGSSQLQRAMAMNYSSLPVEYHSGGMALATLSWTRRECREETARYNFKGIVAISGFQGSLKYETAPYFLALDALASTIGHNGGVVKELRLPEYGSLARIPRAVRDERFRNGRRRDRGVQQPASRIKEIRMVTGYHFGLRQRGGRYLLRLRDRAFARKSFSTRRPSTTDRPRRTRARSVTPNLS